MSQLPKCPNGHTVNDNYDGFTCQKCSEFLYELDYFLNEREFDGNVLLVRYNMRGELSTNVPNDNSLLAIDPDYGYSGSGPRELSFRILVYFLPEERAKIYYKQFSRKFIEILPEIGDYFISKKRIQAWLQDVGAYEE